MKYFQLMLVATLIAALTSTASAKKYFVGITTPWATVDGGHYAATTGTNLITAVNAARNNSGIDTIYVGTGRYFLTKELNLSDVLLGGYQNGETRYYPASSEADNGSDLDKMTVLDGNSFRTTMGNLKHRVATVNAGGVIDGCLIRNGHARSTTTNSDYVKHGGGVLVKGGSVYNCILRGNVAFNPAGSSFSYNSTTPLNSAWTINYPAKGGGVYIDKEGGNVVNCLIYSNMDDLGLGIDCANSGHKGDINIINNTIVNNANCPRMASLINTAGFRIMGQSNDTIGNDGVYTLSRYYIASTETTVGQYCCFLNAIDPIVSGSVYISAADLSAILSANAPLSGHTSETVQAVLSIGTPVPTSVTTPDGSWSLCRYTVSASNHYGQLYYSDKSKIYGPTDARTVGSGESKHHNDYACSYVNWYGGIAYSVWMGGMLPTVAQWYYAACATDNNGGKAPPSLCQSPISKTTTPAYSSVSDAQFEAIAWYSYNSGGYVHQVAKKVPNSVGLYDISGNLYEWCLDWYHYSTVYTGGADAVCVTSGASGRATRGGNWNSNPVSCSLVYRNFNAPISLNFNFGFRLAVVP